MADQGYLMPGEPGLLFGGLMDDPPPADDGDSWYDDVLNTAGDVFNYGGKAVQTARDIETRFFGQDQAAGSGVNPVDVAAGAYQNAGGGAPEGMSTTTMLLIGGAALVAVWFLMK